MSELERGVLGGGRVETLTVQGYPSVHLPDLQRREEPVSVNNVLSLNVIINRFPNPNPNGMNISTELSMVDFYN